MGLTAPCRPAAPGLFAVRSLSSSDLCEMHVGIFSCGSVTIALSLSLSCSQTGNYKVQFPAGNRYIQASKTWKTVSRKPY